MVVKVNKYLRFSCGKTLELGPFIVKIKKETDFNFSNVCADLWEKYLIH